MTFTWHFVLLLGYWWQRWTFSFYWKKLFLQMWWKLQLSGRDLRRWLWMSFAWNDFMWLWWVSILLIFAYIWLISCSHVLISFLCEVATTVHVGFSIHSGLVYWVFSEDYPWLWQFWSWFSSANLSKYLIIYIITFTTFHISMICKQNDI